MSRIAIHLTDTVLNTVGSGLFNPGDIPFDDYVKINATTAENIPLSGLQIYAASTAGVNSPGLSVEDVAEEVTNILYWSPTYTRQLVSRYVPGTKYVLKWVNYPFNTLKNIQEYFMDYFSTPSSTFYTFDYTIPTAYLSEIASASISGATLKQYSDFDDCCNVYCDPGFLINPMVAAAFYTYLQCEDYMPTDQGGITFMAAHPLAMYGFGSTHRLQTSLYSFYAVPAYAAYHLAHLSDCISGAPDYMAMACVGPGASSDVAFNASVPEATFAGQYSCAHPLLVVDDDDVAETEDGESAKYIKRYNPRFIVRRLKQKTSSITNIESSGKFDLGESGKTVYYLRGIGDNNGISAQSGHKSEMRDLLSGYVRTAQGTLSSTVPQAACLYKTGSAALTWWKGTTTPSSDTNVYYPTALQASVIQALVEQAYINVFVPLTSFYAYADSDTQEEMEFRAAYLGNADALTATFDSLGYARITVDDFYIAPTQHYTALGSHHGSSTLASSLNVAGIGPGTVLITSQRSRKETTYSSLVASTYMEYSPLTFGGSTSEGWWYSSIPLYGTALPHGFASSTSSILDDNSLFYPWLVSEEGYNPSCNIIPAHLIVVDAAYHICPAMTFPTGKDLDTYTYVIKRSKGTLTLKEETLS